MRRLMPIAAFAVLLALPLWAQHGGGHAVGGHSGGFAGHAGFSGGHSGGFSGGHMGGGRVSGGMHSGATRGFTHTPSFSQRSFSNHPFLHDGFRGRRARNSGFRNNCFGFRCRGFGYPWGYGYYDPYWWWDSGSSGYQNYDEDYERDRATANEMNQQSLEQQRMLRQEESDGDQDIYSRNSRGSDPAPSESQQGTAILPPTVLIFRDQHKQEIGNYAIVGQTLWNFSPQRTQKIPLSDLDLPATTKANDDRGLTFRVPASGEAE
jgi:hypothetical protein